jgi:hypothetical protein
MFYIPAVKALEGIEQKQRPMGTLFVDKQARAPW